MRPGITRNTPTESITGFNFSRFTVVPVRVAVNPALRMGYVDGPDIDELQQFFY